MDSQNINAAIYSLEKLNYKDKRDVFTKIFSTGNMNGSNNVNDKIVLISLLAFLTFKVKEKDPQATPLKVLLKITEVSEDNSFFYQYLEALSIIVEDFSLGCTTADPCGLTTSKEIISKIKSLLELWLPF